MRRLAGFDRRDLSIDRTRVLAQEPLHRGPVAALTGPVRRGDVNTVERHLAALQGAPVADLYRMLGSIALEIAVEAGLEPAPAERMHRALTQKVAATRRRRRT